MTSKDQFFRFIAIPAVIVVSLFILLYILEDGAINWLIFIPICITFFGGSGIYYLITQKKQSKN